eukprot:g46413.t1
MATTCPERTRSAQVRSPTSGRPTWRRPSPPRSISLTFQRSKLGPDSWHYPDAGNPQENGEDVLACRCSDPAVYIPPQADVKNTLDEIYTTTNVLKTKFPNALFIVASDFNEAKLERVLPQYHQHVSYPTRGLNTLDHCYTTVKDAYCSIPCPHFGKSDHSTVFLLPAYKQKMKQEILHRKEYNAVALTSTIMKCLERLVMAHINYSLPTCLNPLQFAYQQNKSTEDAISLALYSSLEHLDNKDTY